MENTKVILNYLNKAIFELLNKATQEKPELLDLMPIPSIVVEVGPGQKNVMSGFQILEAFISNSIKDGENPEVVLATQFNLITNLQKALYHKLGTEGKNDKLMKCCTQIIELYCETRREVDSSVAEAQ